MSDQTGRSERHDQGNNLIGVLGPQDSTAFTQSGDQYRRHGREPNLGRSSSTAGRRQPTAS